MKIKPLICLFAIGFTFSTSYSRIQAAPPQQVQLYVGELFAVGPNAPMKALSNALKRDEKASEFRVTWSDFSSASSCKATVLYNRKTHILKQYASGSHKMSDEPEKWEGKQELYLYRRVNDQMIHRLAKKNKDTSQYMDTDDFFSELTSLGSKKRQVSRVVHYFGP